MKTAGMVREILAKVCGYYSIDELEDTDDIQVDEALEAMEEYATEREQKYKELYEAMKKLNVYLTNFKGVTPIATVYLRQDISRLESELNLNTK